MRMLSRTQPLRTPFRGPARLASLLCAAGLLLGASSALAYPSYSLDPVANTGYCAHCHGDYNGANYTSLKDGTPWGSNLMAGHQPWVNFDCAGCHPTFPGSMAR